MYPDPFYNNGGAQSQPMWMQMPPGFSPMPVSGPANFSGGDCGGSQQSQGGMPSQNFGFPPAQNYPFPGFGPPPPPNFSGYYPM